METVEVTKVVETTKATEQPEEKSEPLDPMAMLEARRDSILLATPTARELKKVFDTTKKEVLNKLRGKKGIKIEGLDKELSRKNVKRIGKIDGDHILLEYILNVKLWYSYKESFQFTNVDVNLEHNIHNNTWNTIRVNLPDFNSFYVDTPEGKKEVQKAVYQVFSTAIAQSPTVLSTTADALYADYENNTIRAEGKYKEKVIQVSGVVESVGKDDDGYAYILLGTGNSIWGVQCFLGDGNQDDAIKVSKGQRVKIKGQVAQKKLNVMMLYCSVQ